MAVLRSCLKASSALLRRGKMYSGTLILDLLSMVEKAENSARKRRAQVACLCQSLQKAAADDAEESSETKQFAQALGLGPTHRNLGLLLVVHPELVRALEPGNDFADPIDIDQIRAVRPPEKFRI